MQALTLALELELEPVRALMQVLQPGIVLQMEIELERLPALDLLRMLLLDCPHFLRLLFAAQESFWWEVLWEGLVSPWLWALF